MGLQFIRVVRMAIPGFSYSHIMANQFAGSEK